MIYLDGWGPVLDVIEYAHDRSDTQPRVRCLLNWRGRPLVLWLPLFALRVVP